MIFIVSIEASTKTKKMFFLMYVHRDGKPYLHRRHNTTEHFRRECMNPPIASQKTVIKPLSQTMKEPYDLSESVAHAFSLERIGKASKPLDPEILSGKLLLLQQEQEKKEQTDRMMSEKQEQIGRMLKERLTKSAQSHPQPKSSTMLTDLLKPSNFDEDDQSILDHHVSRVFSPGSVSPGQIHRPHQHRSSEMCSSLTDFGEKTKIFPLKKTEFYRMFFFVGFFILASQALRHSKSTPDHATSSFNANTSKKAPFKWPSTNNNNNIDSGISMYSSIGPYKVKDMRSK